MSLLFRKPSNTKSRRKSAGEKRWGWNTDRKRKPVKLDPQKRYDQVAAPVFARYGRTAMPTRQRQSSRTRKRWTFALNASGAELRLPSLPLLQVSWRWVSGSLAVLMVVLLWLFWNSPLYRVNDLAVNGLQRVQTEQLASVLGVQNLPVFVLDPAEMRSTIQAAFPEFDSVSVFIGLPNTVTINVTERQPVLVWRSSRGELLLDSQGYTFPMREIVEGLPVVEAESLPTPAPTVLPADEETPGLPAALAGAAAANLATAAVRADLVTSILAMAKHAPEGAPVVYDPVHGLGWQDARGWKVYFGPQGDQISQRLTVYDALLAYFTENGIQPEFVSVEHLAAPIFRVANGQ